jgi:hypothetical protein
MFCSSSPPQGIDVHFQNSIGPRREHDDEYSLETDKWAAEVQRIQKPQCCDDPWYQLKLVISKTTVQVADKYVDTSTRLHGDGKALFPGVHKYLGGAKDDRDGCIYGIPSHARCVICLYPTTTTTETNTDNIEYKIRLIPLPEYAALGQFKWLRGIICCFVLD